MKPAAVPPRIGDRFQVLCTPGACDSAIAVVAAQHVTRLNFGRYRISTTRPGGADPTTDDIEFTVDASGDELEGRLVPVRLGDVPRTVHAEGCPAAHAPA